MIDENKLLRMFYIVNPDLLGNTKFTVRVTYTLYQEPNGVCVSKDGALCWSVSIMELMFEYTTLEWK